MSDFQTLMGEGEATDYGDGEPVPMEEVATIHENLTEVMGDNTLNAQTENLASENVGEPLPPNPPMEPVGQSGPMGNPTNQFMDNSPDPLESFMEAHSEDFRDVSSMKLADYEEWLFQSESEAGEVAVARIVSNFKASGYDVKPTYAAVAGATWSRMNYAGEEHTEALKKVERASVADLQPLVLEIESEGMTSLIKKVKQAESQADEFRAELIAQIKEEMSAEQQKQAESELEAENWKETAKSYAVPAAFIASIGIGLGILTKWK
tara:strand:- start:2556 stop:3350 length:795 start_codon:yes stop_codon:yes gene_type:complete